METEAKTKDTQPPERNIAAMNARQIMDLFAWYGFTDPPGHPLTSCLDFVALVERATGESLAGAIGSNDYIQQDEAAPVNSLLGEG
jgi:hypothetical protein